MFDDLSWEVVVSFVDIDGIVEHHCLNFHNNSQPHFEANNEPFLSTSVRIEAIMKWVIKIKISSIILW